VIDNIFIIFFALSFLTMTLLFTINIYGYLSSRDRKRSCTTCGYFGKFISVLHDKQILFLFIIMLLSFMLPGFIYFLIVCRDYTCPSCRHTTKSRRSILYPLVK